MEPKQEQTGPDKARDQQKQQQRILFWFSIIVSLLGLAYLLLVLFGGREIVRFGTAEGIVFASILLLSSGLLDKIASLSISGSGIQLQVREVERKVAEQKDKIQKLQWLITYFASDAELEHLRKLAQDGSALCDLTGADLNKMKVELRVLCNRGLISRREGKTIGSLTSSDDLKRWFILLPRGREYVNLREQED